MHSPVKPEDDKVLMGSSYLNSSRVIVELDSTIHAPLFRQG
jgi:hypothetical protein